MNDESVKKLLSLMFGNRDSSFFVIEGLKEMGKTDFMLWIMEQGYRFGFFKGFGCNHELTNAPFDYDLITDLKTLKQRTRNFGKRYFFFLDELGKNAPKTQHWLKLNHQLISSLEVIRKYKLTLGGCSIGDVDSRIRSVNHLDFIIKKTSKTTARLQHLRKRFELRIKDIPRTSIGFSQYVVAPFTLNPVNHELEVFDRDIRIALDWANGVKYTGEMAKSSFYEAVKRGIKKQQENSELGSPTYKREVKEVGVTEPNV